MLREHWHLSMPLVGEAGPSWAWSCDRLECATGELVVDEVTHGA